MNTMTFLVLLAALLLLIGMPSLAGCAAGSGDTTTDINGNGTTADLSVTTAEATTVEETTAAPTATLTLRVGSYNIKHAADTGLDLAPIGQVIKDAKLDIVGVQEVDYCNTRVNGADQAKLLAEAADMPYYKFTRAIDYKGGQYGTLILSKYPIKEFKIIGLESGGKESRSVGHAVLDVNGIRVDFFNTHLSYEQDALRIPQFLKLSELLSKCDRYILTGDFNTGNFAEFTVLCAPLMINRADSRYATYPSSGSPIDNIVLSAGFEEIAAGVVPESHSDHNMLWAEVRLTGSVTYGQ